MSWFIKNTQGVAKRFRKDNNATSRWLLQDLLRWPLWNPFVKLVDREGIIRWLNSTDPRKFKTKVQDLDSGIRPWEIKKYKRHEFSFTQTSLRTSAFLASSPHQRKGPIGAWVLHSLQSWPSMEGTIQGQSLGHLQPNFFLYWSVDLFIVAWSLSTWSNVTWYVPNRLVSCCLISFRMVSFNLLSFDWLLVAYNLFLNGHFF